jgi:putative SOS response-associated peptidase YedK
MIAPEGRFRMCGRVKLEGDFSQLKTTFHIPDNYPAPNYAPSWNVAPTDSLPIVRYNSKDGHRTLDLMRWGLVPYWAKDIKVSFANIECHGGASGQQAGFP